MLRVFVLLIVGQRRDFRSADTVEVHSKQLASELWERCRSVASSVQMVHAQLLTTMAFARSCVPRSVEITRDQSRWERVRPVWRHPFSMSMCGSNLCITHRILKAAGLHMA